MAPKSEEVEGSYFLPQFGICCCFELKTGARIIGWYNVVYGILMLVRLLLSSLSSEEYHPIIIDSRNAEPTLVRHMNAGCVGMIVILPIAGFFILIGVNKRVPRLLLTSVLLLCAGMVLNFYITVLLGVYDQIHYVAPDEEFSAILRKNAVYIGAFTSLFSLFSIFIVNSYHNVLMENPSFGYKSAA